MSILWAWWLRYLSGHLFILLFVFILANCAHLYQVHLQQFLLNHYLGRVAKQQSMQQQQQWGSQLGQYGSSNILSHPLKWQNGLQSDPAFFISDSCLQSSVLDPFGVMFTPQHQLHANVSSLPLVGKRFALSGVLDENGRVVLQQMLCNVQR